MRKFTVDPVAQCTTAAVAGLVRAVRMPALLFVAAASTMPVFAQNGTPDQLAAPEFGVSTHRPAAAVTESGITGNDKRANPSRSATPTLEEVAGMTRLSSLLDRVGRAADVSEQGGACGGIMVHDWIAENLRVVSLGNSVQAVSPIPKGSH